MSKFIGKRVFYHCPQCKQPFSLSTKCVDKSEEINLVFCSKKCYEDWGKADEEAAILNKGKMKKFLKNTVEVGSHQKKVND